MTENVDDRNKLDEDFPLEEAFDLEEVWEPIDEERCSAGADIAASLPTEVRRMALFPAEIPPVPLAADVTCLMPALDPAPAYPDDTLILPAPISAEIATGGFPSSVPANVFADWERTAVLPENDVTKVIGVEGKRFVGRWETARMPTVTAADTVKLDGALHFRQSGSDADDERRDVSGKRAWRAWHLKSR